MCVALTLTAFVLNQARLRKFIRGLVHYFSSALFERMVVLAGLRRVCSIEVGGHSLCVQRSGV